ncbi:MAG: epoxyqueuosine reductase [Clostridia bacterium]|nr:epoxyqueuosine reductase [Clostridia bacterium]
MSFPQQLQDKLMEWGSSFVGFSKVEPGLSPNLSMLKYAVTVGVKLSDFIIDEIGDAPTYTYFHHYRAVNSLLDQITLRGMMLLEDQGFRAIAVPASQTVNDKEDKYSGIFPHKTAAVFAGLGWIGKNGLFISRDFGPRVRLGTILTDMELPASDHKPDSGCGSCRKCVENCPAMALTGENWEAGCERSRIVDAQACSEYMNKKFKHIGRGSVCGICVKVCPFGGSKRKREEVKKD